MNTLVSRAQEPAGCVRLFQSQAHRVLICAGSREMTWRLSATAFPGTSRLPPRALPLWARIRPH